MIWVIIGYMWLFLHRPFEVWPILGTVRLERVYMICTLVAWAAIAEKQLTENRINFAVAIIACAMIISATMSPYTNLFESIALQDWLKYLAFYILVMTSVKTEKDLKNLVTGFLICFFLYMLHSYQEYRNGRYVYAMGTVRMIGVDSTMNDPNAFGASVVYFIPMLLPFVVVIHKKWHYLFVACYCLLSVRCIQLTGSRTAFLALGITIFVAALISKRRFVYIPILLLGSIVLWATLSDNLKDRYRSIVDSSVDESANSSAEGRLKGFWDGLDLLQKSPIYGVGPNCHGLGTGEGFLSHFLYGQIPGELGLIGIVGFLMLIFCFLVNHWEMMCYYQFLDRHGHGSDGLYCFRVSLAVVSILIMLLFFGFGGHNGYRYTWIWCAAFQATALSIMQEKVQLVQKQIAQKNGFI
ncbi:MAG: O-antigen ligase family protein [Thermoguttaceae bacterium]